MNLRPMVDEIKFELVVNKRGDAIFLYQGELQHEYEWVQYDSFDNALCFVTNEGGLQNIGLEITPSLAETFAKTSGVLMVHVADDYSCGTPQLLYFIQPQNYSDEGDF